MLQKSPALVSAAGIEVMAKNISIPGDGSRLEPMIGDPGDGSSPSCAIVDEFHEHHNAQRCRGCEDQQQIQPLHWLLPWTK